MADGDATIRLDQGGINARLLANEAKVDFRRVESASRKIQATFHSPEVKRLFVRYLNSMQLNTYLISVIARTKLMRHYDAVLPGRVHRVIYEDLVANTEHEVRRLLDYCGLPFENACLRFFENERPVRTASSEQVRQPIYTSGVDHWRHFEPWLDPLKQALGPALTDYAG